jgi:hypothetical protein
MHLSGKKNSHNLSLRTYQTLVRIITGLIVFTFLAIFNLNYATDINKESVVFEPFETEGSSGGGDSFVHLVTFGRLGNQLFQYACFYSLARKLRIPLFLEVPRINGSGENEVFNLHRLHVPIPSDETRKHFLQKVMNQPEKVFALFDQDILAGYYPVSLNKDLIFSKKCLDWQICNASSTV